MSRYSHDTCCLQEESTYFGMEVSAHFDLEVLGQFDTENHKRIIGNIDIEFFDYTNFS